MSSASSQISSPVNSQVSSPYASPLPSPIATPDFNYNKREAERHDDTGVGGLSTGQDSASEHETPGSNEDEENATEEKNDGSMKSPWKERRDSGVGNSLTRPNR